MTDSTQQKRFVGMSLNPVNRIAEIIEAASAKSRGGYATGIPTLSHLEAAAQIVKEFRILEAMTMEELQAANGASNKDKAGAK